jgi:hypothetical protein
VDHRVEPPPWAASAAGPPPGGAVGEPAAAGPDPAVIPHPGARAAPAPGAGQEAAQTGPPEPPPPLPAERVGPEAEIPQPVPPLAPPPWEAGAAGDPPGPSPAGAGEGEAPGNGRVPGYLYPGDAPPLAGENGPLAEPGGALGSADAAYPGDGAYPGVAAYPAASVSPGASYAPGAGYPPPAAPAKPHDPAGLGPGGPGTWDPAGAGPAGTHHAPGATAGPPDPGQPRRANLVVARLEPWSVMKFSFLMSLVAWIILFVAVALLYYALSGLGVFAAVQRTISNVTSSQSSPGVNLSRWTSAPRVLGYTMLIGAVNVVLITALSTVGAMIYNLVTRLGGGIEVTLREPE